MRGTFTQRHLELHDQTTGARHLVLAGAATAGGAPAEIHNTPLIENAVLCFEYGISLADPHRLVVWEAQFGEFLNVAQAVFDQCIACGEDRWLRASGLVILLPHGIDGGGPDHSTGRPERLLAACAGANLQVVNASTPANFFHVLRRQMHRPFRKPLVVLSPKYLLRHKACVSPLADFETGTGFRPVIPDATVRNARRVVLCTGKVFYELQAARAARHLDSDIALVRIEQLHPFPAALVAEALAAHPGAEHRLVRGGTRQHGLLPAPARPAGSRRRPPRAPRRPSRRRHPRRRRQILARSRNRRLPRPGAGSCAVLGTRHSRQASLHPSSRKSSPAHRAGARLSGINTERRPCKGPGSARARLQRDTQAGMTGGLPCSTGPRAYQPARPRNAASRVADGRTRRPSLP